MELSEAAGELPAWAAVPLDDVEAFAPASGSDCGIPEVEPLTLPALLPVVALGAWGVVAVALLCEVPADPLVEALLLGVVLATSLPGVVEALALAEGVADPLALDDGVVALAEGVVDALALDDGVVALAEGVVDALALDDGVVALVEGVIDALALDDGVVEVLALAEALGVVWLLPGDVELASLPVIVPDAAVVFPAMLPEVLGAAVVPAFAPVEVLALAPVELVALIVSLSFTLFTPGMDFTVSTAWLRSAFDPTVPVRETTPFLASAWTLENAGLVESCCLTCCCRVSLDTMSCLLVLVVLV